MKGGLRRGKAGEGRVRMYEEQYRDMGSRAAHDPEVRGNARKGGYRRGKKIEGRVRWLGRENGSMQRHTSRNKRGMPSREKERRGKDNRSVRRQRTLMQNKAL